MKISSPTDELWQGNPEIFYTEIHPQICAMFICGNVLSPQEKLFGDVCWQHSGTFRPIVYPIDKNKIAR